MKTFKALLLIFSLFTVKESKSFYNSDSCNWKKTTVTLDSNKLTLAEMIVEIDTTIFQLEMIYGLQQFRNKECTISPVAIEYNLKQAIKNVKKDTSLFYKNLGDGIHLGLYASHRNDEERVAANFYKEAWTGNVVTIQIICSKTYYDEYYGCFLEMIESLNVKE